MPGQSSSALVRLRLVVGPALLVGAVVGFVVLPRYAPAGGSGGGESLRESANPFDAPLAAAPAALSESLYDVLRITTWALLIVGMVVVIAGLIDYARR